MPMSGWVNELEAFLSDYVLEKEALLLITFIC